MNRNELNSVTLGLGASNPWQVMSATASLAVTGSLGGTLRQLVHVGGTLTTSLTVTPTVTVNKRSYVRVATGITQSVKLTGSVPARRQRRMAAARSLAISGALHTYKTRYMSLAETMAITTTASNHKYLRKTMRGSTTLAGAGSLTGTFRQRTTHTASIRQPVRVTGAVGATRRSQVRMRLAQGLVCRASLPNHKNSRVRMRVTENVALHGSVRVSGLKFMDGVGLLRLYGSTDFGKEFLNTPAPEDRIVFVPQQYRTAVVPGQARTGVA